jgi:tetratricopeptide (TPR) repeat protein
MVSARLILKIMISGNKHSLRKSSLPVLSALAFVSALSFSLALTGCVTPPQIEHSSVIDNDELQLISNIKRGKDLALSGRMDLAEQKFRLELIKYPKQSSIYADLGYVLIEQNRLEEAAAQLRMAIRLNPLNLPAHEQLARALFRQDLYQEAIEEYEQLLDLILGEIASGRTAETARAADVIRIYRDMSTVYHALGKYDEAICYSQLSRDIGGDGLQHIRLLLSLDRVSTATGLLKGIVASGGAATPPNILLDFGAALLASGDKIRGKQALDRALSAASSDAETRIEARLLKIKLADDEQNSEDLELLYQSLLDENPKLCTASDIVSAPLYWPTVLTKQMDQIEQVIKKMCDE